MIRNAWMSLAACVGTDGGKSYNAKPEPARVDFCRHECPVMNECRQHVLATTPPGARADELEPAGGMSARRIASEVRRRDGVVVAEPQEDLLSYIDHEIRAALVGAA